MLEKNEDEINLLLVVSICCTFFVVIGAPLPADFQFTKNKKNEKAFSRTRS
jgi:hypothetical protein